MTSYYTRMSHGTFIWLSTWRFRCVKIFRLLFSPKHLYYVFRTDEPKYALEHGKLCKSIANKMYVLIGLSCTPLHCTETKYTTDTYFTVKWCLNFKQLNIRSTSGSSETCLLIHWLKWNFSEVSGEILKVAHTKKSFPFPQWNNN